MSNIVSIAGADWLVNHCSAECTLQYTYYKKLPASQVGPLGDTIRIGKLPNAVDKYLYEISLKC